MSKLNILIVGTGPASFGFLNGLKDFSDLNITLVDNAVIPDVNDECSFKNEFIVGNRKLENNKSNNPLISSDFGGFSNVWGGTFDNPSNEIIGKFTNLEIDIYKYLKKVEELVPRFVFTNNEIKDKNIVTFKSVLNQNTLSGFSSRGLKIIDSEIATNKDILINFKNDEICDFCGEIKSFCREDSIWNSKKFIKELIKKNKIVYHEDTELKNFKELENKVECKLINNNNEKIEYFDKLILATGPVSTSQIVLNSKVVEEITINTTDLMQVPFLKFFQTSKKLHSFSDLFSSIKVFGYNTYHQHYFYSKSILILSKNAFKLTKLLKIFPNVFLSFIGGMFITFESSISSKIIMTYSKNGIDTKFVDGISKKRNKILRKLSRQFFKSRIFLILFLKKGYLNGSSYHNGAQFPINKLSSNTTSDKLGRISNLKNTHIVDSSVLPEINAGPGVKLIIANSYRIGSKIFE